MNEAGSSEGDQGGHEAPVSHLQLTPTPTPTRHPGSPSAPWQGCSTEENGDEGD